jgi:hypothetical protein
MTKGVISVATWPYPTDSGSGEQPPMQQAAAQGRAEERPQPPPPDPSTYWAPPPGYAAPPPGYAAPPPGYSQAYPVARSSAGNGLAIASLVLGITSIVFCWWGLVSLAQVVLAVVFGCIGISRANRGAWGKGQATTGLVCGCVGGILYFIFGILTLGAGFII